MLASNTKEALVNDVKSGANRVKDDVRHTANDMYNDLESSAGKAGRKIRDCIDTAGDEISHATKSITAQINEKPIQSSIVALLAGFVIGALFRR